MKKIEAYINNAPTVGNTTKIGYYRLTKEMKEFLELVNKNEEIVGFEWTSGEYNFGIIIR